jgi:hypothetical protein
MKQYFALKEHVNLTLTPENYTKDDDENDYYNRQNGMWNSKTIIVVKFIFLLHTSLFSVYRKFLTTNIYFSSLHYTIMKTVFKSVQVRKPTHIHWLSTILVT